MLNKTKFTKRLEKGRLKHKSPCFLAVPYFQLNYCKPFVLSESLGDISPIIFPPNNRNITYFIIWEEIPRKQRKEGI